MQVTDIQYKNSQAVTLQPLSLKNTAAEELKSYLIIFCIPLTTEVII